MKREDIEKILHNSSHGKQKWYVIFNGPFRGIYNDWAIASTHIIEKSVSHKSYLTREAAEKSLGESYKTVTTEEIQKSQQFVSLNQHLQSQIAKLNAINRMKNVPATSEREKMRRPSVGNFQRLWDSLISYNDVHTTMMFYPKRRETGPKVVFFPQASPKDVYDYFIHGLIDSLYFHDSNPRELQEFLPKVQNAINGHFAKGRELYLKMHSSFPIFNRERNLVVPSITIARLGVSNQDYLLKDVNVEPTTPTLDDLALSLFRVYIGSSKIGSGLGRTEKPSVIGMLIPSEQYSQWCRGVLDRYPHSNFLRSSGNGANSDGEDDCSVFEVYVTGSGCFCVLVDVSILKFFQGFGLSFAIDYIALFLLFQWRLLVL
ncbi:enzymatic polyprotein [Tanacetum coccineum]